MTGTWAEFYLDMDMILCGHFRAVGGCVLSSPVLNLSKNHHLPISFDVLRFPLFSEFMGQELLGW